MAGPQGAAQDPVTEPDVVWALAARTVAAGVEFRFSQRLHDATTAHDTGIIHYWFAPTGGDLRRLH